MGCVKQWSDNGWEKMSGGEAIWCKCKTQLVAGELLGMHVHTLCTKIGIGRYIGTTNLKYAVSKKDQPLKIA